MVSCQKGPTRHANAWQIGPFGRMRSTSLNMMSAARVKMMLTVEQGWIKNNTQHKYAIIRLTRDQF